MAKNRDFSDSPMERRQVLKSAGALLACSMFDPSASKAWAQAQTAEHQIWRKGMIGFQLAFEQFSIAELVELGVEVEKAGFDVLTASDHLQPWQANQGHSGQAWSPWRQLASGPAHTNGNHRHLSHFSI